MSHEDPGSVAYSDIGGLSKQLRELREVSHSQGKGRAARRAAPPPPHTRTSRLQVIELPLKNPELFMRVGIKPPKGCLLYGPPGTGKTLLARAVASNVDANFLKVVSSAIVDKYIGESARLVREMFGYAREHEPCIIFMDEIDAIGGRRFSEGTSADREIQRTLMEVGGLGEGRAGVVERQVGKGGAHDGKMLPFFLFFSSSPLTLSPCTLAFEPDGRL